MPLINMTYNFPKGVCTLEDSDTLVLDLGHGTTLTLLCGLGTHDQPHNMFCFLRQTITEKGKRLVITRGNNTFNSNCKIQYFHQEYTVCSWEYFGLDDSLAVQTKAEVDAYVIVKLGKSQVEISDLEKNTYMLMRSLADKKYEQELPTSTQSPQTIGDDSFFQGIFSNPDSSDFSIVCSDGESIPVHTFVLNTYWPFFKNMMSHDCVEKTEKRLGLDFPSSWVKLLVAHLYQKPLNPTLDEATGLLVLSHMYVLPKLGEEVNEKIKTLVTKETDINDLILGWERSSQVENNTQKLFFARKIALHSKGGLKNWDETKLLELLELYFDAMKLI